MLNKLKWKLQQYMIGRNGSDDLCRSLTGVSFVIYIISVIADSGLLLIEQYETEFAHVFVAQKQPT